MKRSCLLSDLAADIRYAGRSFARTPAFTGVVVGILALGLGANISTFSVTDALLLRLLPVKEPAALFRTVGISADAAAGSTNASYQTFREMQQRTRPFAEVMAYSAAAEQSIAVDGAIPERLSQQTVSGNYFSVLGVEPVLGRTISLADDGAPGSAPVAVISYSFWMRAFGGHRSGVLGHKLRFGDHAFEIIGVAPRRFFGVEVGKTVDIWTPIAMAASANLTNDHLFWLQPMGRLKPGATIAQAVAPMQAVRHEFMLEDVRQHAPPGTPVAIIQRFLAGTRIKGIPAGGGVSSLRSEYRQPLQVMMFLVALVLLIACTNVANLLIARGSSRQQEIAVRLSLGASRTRVWRQLITESVLLGSIATGLGLLFAQGAAPVLVRLLTPSSDPAKLSLGVGSHLLVFTGSLALLTVLVCGVLPAIRLSGTDIHAAFKSGGRLTHSGGKFARKALVALQVALSLVLVVGAMLFTRTLLNLLSSSIGFHPKQVLVTRLSYENSNERRSSFSAWQQLLQRTRELPGVEAASLASASLFGGNPGLMGLRTASATKDPPDPTAGVVFISTAYFETLGIQFVSGRDFELRDNRAASVPVAIVNQAFVRKFFGGADPLGQRITRMANAPLWTTITGVVKDAKFSGLRQPAPPLLYLPFGRLSEWIPPQFHGDSSLSLQVHGRQSVTALSANLRRITEQRFTTGEVVAQRQLIDDTLVRERLLANVASLFGGLALLLAALGLYGIVSYAVVERRREIGVRMAIGAAPSSILSLMLRDSVLLVSAGTLGGIVAASALARLTNGLLYGLASNDLTAFISSAGILLVTAFVATLIPAYRAARTDPMIALRYE